MSDGLSLITRDRIVLAAAAMAAIVMPLWLLSGDTSSKDPSNPAAPTPLKAVSMELPAEALAAPLFNADREPPAAVDASANATDAATAAPPAPPPSLVGLIVGHGTPGLALARGADGQTHLLHAGEAIDGWQLVGITASGATFDLNGRQEKVDLAFAKPAASSPPAANASPSSASPPPPGNESGPNQPSPAGQPFPAGPRK